MISKYKKIEETNSSLSSSEESSEGEFNGRHTKTGETSSQRHPFGNNDGSFPKLVARPVNYGMGKMREVVFPEETAAGLVNNYINQYSNFKFSDISKYSLLRLNKQGRDISYSEILKRLLKIGLILKPGPILNRFNRHDIILPMFEVGNFNMSDRFGWFCWNDGIKQIFDKITQSFRIMQLLEKICHQKIEKFECKPVVTFNHVNSFKQQKSVANKQQGYQVNITHDGPHNLTNIQRMQRKQMALTFVDNKMVEDKKLVLNCLKHYEAVWLIMSFDFHPCKAYAYMLFEAILNHALSTKTKLGSEEFDHNPLKGFILNHLSRSFGILAGSLELLLPHATEITKAFEINLRLDERLSSLLSLYKSVAPHLVINEFGEYSDLQREVDGYRQRSTQKPSLRLETKEHSLSLEQRNAIEANKAQSKETAQKLVQARKEAELEREKKATEKDKRLKDRNQERAEKIVEKAKQEEAQREEIETKKRRELQIKFHDLPSERLVDELINCLNAHNTIIYNVIFSKHGNNNVINDQQVTNLADQFKDLLIAYSIGCAIDFYNEVIARIHRRHDSDTGDLLPSHYIDILRTCFIIFGLFPKGWEPKTREDFDAMEKFLQRKVDAHYLKMGSYDK